MKLFTCIEVSTSPAQAWVVMFDLNFNHIESKVMARAAHTDFFIYTTAIVYRERGNKHMESLKKCAW